MEVLTEQADGRYLAYLEELGIPYLIAGEQEIDVNLALKIIDDHLSPAFYLLEGGSVVNGYFLRAGCVDELSLVQAPVTGDADSKPLFCEGEACSFDLTGTEPKEGALVMHYRKTP